MPTPPPFSPLIALLTVTQVWEADLAAALKPLGLTTRKYGLLAHVGATPGISFSELARRSRITVQSAHTAVEALSTAGLVSDSTAHAGSASTLQVTAKGERTLKQAADVLHDLDADLTQKQPELTEALWPAMRRQLEGK